MRELMAKLQLEAVVQGVPSRFGGGCPAGAVTKVAHPAQRVVGKKGERCGGSNIVLDLCGGVRIVDIVEGQRIRRAPRARTYDHGLVLGIGWLVRGSRGQERDVDGVGPIV